MQVVFNATVSGLPHRFFGTGTRAEHESFPARTQSGREVEVVTNLEFAPWLPVEPGDHVRVGGELTKSDRGPGEVVHWTHHDPAGRHVAGFIAWNGRWYA
jgi:hypothetical protein